MTRGFLLAGLWAFWFFLESLALATADGFHPYSPVPMTDPRDRFEARIGAFAHGTNTHEKNTVDLNGSIVSPRLSFGIAEPWATFVPRLQLGGALNLSGKTSFAYLDALWTFPVWGGVFVEGFVGPSVHNGTTTPSPNHTGLGCPILFHAGASIGYRFNEHWSLMATFEHLSNGKGAFGINCGTNQGPNGNQGLNNYGARLGYTF